MISAEDNELLTRTGRQTTAGGYFRRFWMPALLCEEIPTPDCPPVRVRLLGENLVAFRDSSGRAALVDAYCMHRQADLFFGRNEHNGIRCVYHGWKYDADGNCVEMPEDPAADNYMLEVKLKSYPCQEHAGMVWAYLGPGNLPVQFPGFEFNALPRDRIYIRKSLLECNYLQAMEGNLDSSHLRHLHGFIGGGSAPMHGFATRAGAAPDGPEAVRQEQALAAQAIRETRPTHEIKETDYGFMLAAKRALPDSKAYWRVNQWLLPNHTMVANAPGETLLWDAWVPMDDEHTWVYRVEYNPWRAISEQEIFEFNHVGLTHLNVENIPGTYSPARNRRNDYLIDRTLQRTYSNTGIRGSNAQDAAVIENQGPTPIHDRTREFFVVGDIGIVRARKRLLDEFKAFRQGVEPAAAMNGDLYKVRPIAVTLEDDGTPFHEGAHEYIYV